jgi:hypothetical protein
VCLYLFRREITDFGKRAFEQLDRSGGTKFALYERVENLAAQGVEYWRIGIKFLYGSNENIGYRRHALRNRLTQQGWVDFGPVVASRL